MNHVKLLDCTLRDGGYINDWRFGRKNIQTIVRLLECANIDIIECGFLASGEYDPERSIFSDMNQVASFISPKKDDLMYVGMITFGSMAAEQIPARSGASLDGIRLTFHKSEWDGTAILAKNLMEKGYKVFIQPVGTVSYTDAEFLALTEKVNQLKPYAFYIVDTLGSMYQNQLLHLFSLLENNLSPDIVVGFHSHNNLQLAFSNAQVLIGTQTKRTLIIDASVYGMGRAAGNLCTELIAQYINKNIAPQYEVTPLLQIVDEHLLAIYNRTPWGYSVPYYLAAVRDVHPDYATWLLNKQTLGIEAISHILKSIPTAQAPLYDKALLEQLYLDYQMCAVDDRESRKALQSLLMAGRPILLLGPGKSIISHHAEVQTYIQKTNCYIIAVNFLAETYRPNLLFISNAKRFSSFSDAAKTGIPLAITSNIPDRPSSAYVINYSALLGEGSEADSAGPMLLRLLHQLGAEQAVLAGFDGLSATSDGSYADAALDNLVERDAIEAKNEAVKAQLKRLGGMMSLSYLTPSYYDS